MKYLDQKGKQNYFLSLINNLLFIIINIFFYVTLLLKIIIIINNYFLDSLGELSTRIFSM